MADENITDIVNQLVGEETEDTSNEPVEVPQENIAQLKQQAGQQRGQVVKEVRQAQNTSYVNEAKKTAQTYKQQIEELRKEISDLKAGAKSHGDKLGSLEKISQTHSDRMLTDDVIAKENLLTKHDKYGKYFNRDEVRKHYIDAAKNQNRYFDPEESMKILKFDEIADKLERYERANEFRKSLYEGGFAKSNTQTADDGLSDVKDPNAAEAWMRKKAGELGL